MKELKSLGALGPGIIEVISKFSFLTRCSGGKLALINKTIQQSSHFCLNS